MIAVKLVDDSGLSDGGRATLAVARKMVAHMLAVDRRKTAFVAAGGLQKMAAV